MEDYEMAIAALVLGIVSLLAWLLPIVGLPVSIVGLVLGIKTVKSEKKAMAIAAIIMSSIGLVLTIINGALGAYMAVTGQIPGLG